MRHLSLLEKIIRIVVLKKERTTEIFLIDRGDTYRLDPTVPRTNLFVFLSRVTFTYMSSTRIAISSRLVGVPHPCINRGSILRCLGIKEG